ncbi:MAG TPA: polyphosphate kinase 1 [Gemmatimonadaceae bacterium]|nr:polyphosphate kinase 1 [Gemmatimonadaceae bacterium]
MPPLMTAAPTPSLYFNRELSWLAFNERVLHEAQDDRNPLLERVKFLAIFANNLDEFIMVRVAGLRRQVAAGVQQTPPDGLTPQEQLDALGRKIAELTAAQNACLAELLARLGDHGVRLVPVDELDAAERGAMDAYFRREVFPVLTPLVVDPGHPFPHISNLSISLAVEIRDPDTGAVRFARVKVPRSLPRWVPIEGRTHQFVPLEQLVGSHLEALFPGVDVLDWYAFRITRYSDLELPEFLDEPEDLLATIEEQVFKRRFGEVIRLDVVDDMPRHLRDLLLEELRDEGVMPAGALTERDILEAGTLLGLGDLLSLASLDLPALRDLPYVPNTPRALRDPARSIFDVIRERDMLVHHPFDSFSATVERFIEEAARDDQVLAIKMTLYRTSGDSEIVDALTEAAQRGKQVAVIVELKARFDETNNITWARQLEEVGAHVAYGAATLKTHAKTVLVVRREADGIRRYVHIGSGNYNSRTARIYTDVGLFTCSPAVGDDVTEMFNALTGFSRKRTYQTLLVAPVSMRSRFVELLEREAAHARAGRPARVIAKMNALVDAEIIRALYAASEAGVEIDLIIRGICCLRPGIPGVSERIRVRSIIGRFLEHSRLWYFANGGAGQYYLGSADWMPRNFDRRVEAVAPVEDRTLHPRLRALFETLLADNRQAWELDADGVWHQVMPNGPVWATHVVLLRDSWGRSPAEVSADLADAEEQRVESRP